MPNLSGKFIILDNIYERSGIANMQILSLTNSNEQAYLHKNVDEKVDIFNKTI